MIFEYGLGCRRNWTLSYGVLSSRRLLDTQTLKNHLPGQPNLFVKKFWNVNLKNIVEFCYHNIIPMTLYKNSMAYFNKFIHVYVWNLSILWSGLVPFDKIDAQQFYNCQFWAPSSQSWLRPWTLFWSPTAQRRKRIFILSVSHGVSRKWVTWGHPPHM